MLNALAPVFPAVLLEIVKAYGYQLWGEDQYNWLLISESHDEPIVLPKLGEFVALEVLHDIVFTKAGMNLREYLALKHKIEAGGTGFIN